MNVSPAAWFPLRTTLVKTGVRCMRQTGQVARQRPADSTVASWVIPPPMHQ